MSDESVPALTTANVWARELVVVENPARQLLVPASTLDIVKDDAGGLSVGNEYGRWPATRSPGGGDGEVLTACLPMLPPRLVRVTWRGPLHLSNPEQVLATYAGAIGLRDWREEGSLRRPQLGALHSILGYWASGMADPAVVVMPTGTGKTETMLALLVTARMNRLLVIVPTAALRDQIADKFQTLGVLQRFGIVTPAAARPVVGRLEHGIADPDDARRLVQSCNVIVATTQALGHCSSAAAERLYEQFTHLIVDEAHHAPARTWSQVIDVFAGRPVVLFTATPYREDGKSLPGRTVFRFPLREAQADGYFSHIDYRAVLSLDGTDNTLADQALARLRSDLAEGLDHVLMARVGSVARATDLAALYAAKAGDLGPRAVHTGMPKPQRTAVFQALATRQCRIVICVDMLGEGFDMPELKIAVLHDVKKSLGPMIQFIGRFSRSPSDNRHIGTASVFVARDPRMALSPLRDLLREDADWDLLLRDITDRATDAVEALGEFERSFSGVPESVPVSLLEPKMSAIAHRAPSSTWRPEQAAEVYGADRLLPPGVAAGAAGTVAWFVVEHRDPVSWGDIAALEETTYELVIMYFDDARRLLYIYGSAKSGDYGELADAVLGEGRTTIAGMPTFRVLAGLDRLIPTNVGLLDARDHFNRFSMHVGSDVGEAMDTADKSTKSQTHIATSGFDNGERVSISAAMSGRFWSTRTAANLKAWIDWCDAQGAKLLDTSIDLRQVVEGFIIPEDLDARPAHVLLALEWPWPIVGNLTPGPDITYGDVTYPLLDVGFEVDDHGTEGAFLFSLVTSAWRIPYQATFEREGLTYTPVDRDAQVSSRPAPVPLRTWLNKNKPTLFLDGDRMITPEDRLLAPRNDLPPFDRTRLTPLDWSGVDIRVESQRSERRPESIQAFMANRLRTSQEFDVLIDDDGSGEAADLVGIAIREEHLIVTLVHCKYSSSSSPGARVGDLYELCGQAMRGAKWRQQGALPLLYHLDRRAKWRHQRTGQTPYELGDIHQLYRIRELAPQLRPRFHTILAQPGLSAAAATDEHLRLIAGAESYVRAVTKGSFTVYCSP